MRSFLLSLSQLVFALLMYCMATLFLGVALIPGIALVFNAWKAGIGASILTRFFFLGISLAAGYFIFGLTLLLLVGFARIILGLRLKEGNHKVFSLDTFIWAFNSTLYLLVNFTFIDFLLLTPFVNLLHRLLGAKLGENVQINSKFVFDASLLEIGDNTVIGGGAVVIGHIVERGILKLKKVKIGKNVTIGSNAVIMPGCEIGDNAIIGVGTVLLKNTLVAPRAVYFGVPAEPLRPKHAEDKNA